MENYNFFKTFVNRKKYFEIKHKLLGSCSYQGVFQDREKIGLYRGSLVSEKIPAPFSLYILLCFFVFGGIQINLPAQELPHQYSLFTDKKGKQVDDLLTILIVEQAQAKNNTRTETDIDQKSAFNLAAGKGKLAGLIPGMGMGFNQASDYDGQGKTSRSGEVAGKVSARVVAIYENGNMLIEGHKEVEINNETEIIRVTGIIRPEDINYDNTLFSHKIANAKIQYTGKGDTQNAHRPGIFTRFINWIF